MLTTLDIRKAIADKLKNKWNYKVYGREVTEGFDRPSFFIDIITQSDYQNVNTQYVQRTVTITYFQASFDALDNEKVYDEIKEIMGLKLHVEDRYLTISNIRIEYTGENMEIMQCLFDLKYYDEVIKQIEEYELMQEIKINERVND